MRQILFRAKRIDNGEWVYGFYQEYPEDYVHIQNTYNDWFPVYPNTIGQWTGLVDKNCTRIFEGDIIRMYYRDGESDIGVVKYNEDQARFLYYEDNIFAYGIDNTCTMEVVGNVFDNLELLEM